MVRSFPMPPILKTTYASPRKFLATSRDRKSTRLNSSHSQISYAVFCLKKKNQKVRERQVDGDEQPGLGDLPYHLHPAQHHTRGLPLLRSPPRLALYLRVHRHREVRHC